MKVVGFTGTRRGMTQEQRTVFMNLMRQLAPTELHHGNCIGSDAEAEAIVDRYHQDCTIHRHPPLSNVCENIRTELKIGSLVTHPRKGYLQRDDDIVKCSEVIVATPKSTTEEMKGSGTWYTVRQARKMGRKLFIIFPDGSIQEE